MRTAIAFFMFFVIGSSAVYADSDGYFCSSDKFLAYQFSFSKEPYDKHMLYIIPFRSPLSANPISIQVPDFQVHAMTCTNKSVELLGWEKKNIVNFENNTLISSFEEKLPSPGNFPKDYFKHQKNLAGLSPVMSGPMPKEYRLKLASDNSGNSYELQIERQDSGNPCRAIVETSIVLLDSDKRKKELTTIYRDEVPAECGE